MISNPYPGKFITFEGIDGSGKSEQYARSVSFLKAYFKDLKLALTKEPTDQPSGREIYSILRKQHPTLKLSEMHSYQFQEMYFRDRVWNYRNRVIPWISSGIHVLADRGPVSVVFGADSYANFDDLMNIQEQVFKYSGTDFIWPDGNIIYDVPVEVAMDRMLKSGKVLDQFEEIENLRRVRNNYLAFAQDYDNCYVIDGSKSPQEVFEMTKNVLYFILGLTDSTDL